MNTMEFAILDFIQNNIRCGFLDFLMPKITALGNAGVLWIILTVIFLISKKYRNTGIVMAAALILDLIGCNLILKPLVARERPFEINSAVNLRLQRIIHSLQAIRQHHLPLWEQCILQNISTGKYLV